MSDTEDETQRFKSTRFQKVAVTAISVFVAMIIVVSFTHSSYMISTPIVVLISILVVLCLAETFDEFQILNLLNVSRKAKELKNKNKELKEENFNLYNKMISLAQSISNSNSNSNSSSQNHIYLEKPQVKQATEQDKADKELLEANSKVATLANQVEVPALSAPYRPISESESFRLQLRKIDVEKFVISKFFTNEDIKPVNFKRDVKIASLAGAASSDPISDRSIIFDAWGLWGFQEYFLEVKIDYGISNQTMLDRIYTQLAQVYFYGQMIKHQPKLMLLVVIPPEKAMLQGRTPSILNMISRYFQPAIRNGLLQVESIEITEKEIKELQIVTDKEALDSNTSQ